MKANVFASIWMHNGLAIATCRCCGAVDKNVNSAWACSKFQTFWQKPTLKAHCSIKTERIFKIQTNNNEFRVVHSHFWNKKVEGSKFVGPALYYGILTPCKKWSFNSPNSIYFDENIFDFLCEDSPRCYYDQFLTQVTEHKTHSTSYKCLPNLAFL